MYSIRILREVHNSNSKCAEKVYQKHRPSVIIDKVDNCISGTTRFEVSMQNSTKQVMKKKCC